MITALEKVKYNLLARKKTNILLLVLRQLHKDISCRKPKLVVSKTAVVPRIVYNAC
jgi:hypothetical protein